MKQIVGTDIGGYTFSPIASEITLTGVSITLEQILLITNVTSKEIIYSFADPLKSGEISGNVITLYTDVSSMSDTDKLQIILDLPNTLAEESTLVSTMASLTTELQELNRHNRYLASNMPNARDSSDRMRVSVDNNIVSATYSYWGSANSQPTYYSTGSPNSMDARELEYTQSLILMELRRSKWSIT